MRIGQQAPQVVGTNDPSSLASVVFLDPPSSGPVPVKALLGRSATLMVGGRSVSVVDLVAGLLHQACERACQVINGVPDAVVLTHPATWDAHQMGQFLEAIALAAIPNPQLVSEPVAAAQLMRQSGPVPVRSMFLLFDQGAGALSTTVVRATDEAFVVVGSPHREPGLGGDSFDRALLHHLGSTRLPIEVWSALRAANTPAWRQAAESFRDEVRGAKHTLGGTPRADLQVSTPDGTGSVFLERDDASSVLRELLEGGVQLAQRTLESAGITTAGQVTFALTGGGSQLPLVRGALEQRFPGLSLLIPLDPSTVVAQGATLAAASPGPLPSAASPWAPPGSPLPPAGPSSALLNPPFSAAVPPIAPIDPPFPLPGSSWAPPPMDTEATTTSTQARATSLIALPGQHPPTLPERAAIKSGRPNRTIALAVAAVFTLITAIGVVVLATRGDAGPATDRASASRDAEATSQPALSTTTAPTAAPPTTVPAATVPATTVPATTTAPPTVPPPTVAVSVPTPGSLAEWERLWERQRQAMVTKIKAGNYGISADGKSALLADGYRIDLSTCPAGWSNTEGLTDTQITIGHTTAQSGTLAVYGQIATGIETYLSAVNNAGGITDANGVSRTLNLSIKDDGYDSARTIPLVDEFVNSKQVFSLLTLGSPNTMRTYDKVNRSCVPQPLALTGHPAWGDPVSHPWTSGEQMAYNTEAMLWGRFLEDHAAELLARDGKITVAAVVMNNDFGHAYRNGMERWLAQSPIQASVELVFADIEPSASSLSAPMANLAASGPEVFIAMTAGTSCTQTVVEAARNGMKATASYLFQPSVCKSNAFLGRDKVGGDGSATNGWWVVGGGVKALESPAFDNDVWAQQSRELLTAAGVDWARNPTYFAGAARWGWTLQQLFTVASQLNGGLTRVNLMVALRNMDMTAPFLLEGIRFTLNGSSDAYLTEGSEIAQYDASQQAFSRVGDVLDISGTTPPCVWRTFSAACD